MCVTNIMVFSHLLVFTLLYQSVMSVPNKSHSEEFHHLYCIDIKHGNDSNQCLINDTKCCATLDYTLSSMIQVLPDNNGAVIHIYNTGNYILEHSYSITHTNQLSIIAVTNNDNETSTVNVTCNNEAGLSFINSSNIIIKGLNFIKCGAIQQSTDSNILNSSYTNPQTLLYHVGLYFLYCDNLTITQVNFTNTLGVSVALYNSVGNIYINNCIFCNATKHVHGDASGGGGALQIEFSYCPPGIGNCSRPIIPKKYSSNANIYITNNIFNNNSAHRYHDSHLYRYDSTGVHSYNFGNGAGLSIVLKGNASNNNFMITDCTFNNNWAHYGGAFYVGFFDHSRNNCILMDNINVSRNYNFDAILELSHWDADTTGGGGLVLYQSGSEGQNKVVIRNSFFADNIGNSGGALSVQGVSALGTLDGSLLISNVTFRNNSAYLGSAVYLFLDNVFHHRTTPLLIVTLNNSNLTNNIPLCLVRGTRHIASLPCTGIIYASNQPLYLSETVNFIGNQGSSLELHYTTVYILKGAKVNFLNNTTIHGAGMSLYDCSYVTINENTVFLFVNNTAEYGAAVYASHCTSGESQTAALSSNCVFSYYNISIHPDDWKTNFTFIQNNENHTDHSVLYIKSLVSCYWPQKDTYKVIPENTFSWTPFDCTKNGFNNCSSLVVSGLLYMRYEENTIPNKCPGQPLPMPTLYDGKRKKIKKNTSLSACILNDYTSQNDVGSLYKNCDKSGPRCVPFHSKDPISLYYCPSFKHHTVSEFAYTFLTIKSQGKIEVVVRVNFTKCRWPYSLDKIYHSHCTLDINEFCCSNTSLCNSGDHSCEINSIIHPRLSYCVSVVNSSQDDTQKQFIYGRCPISYGNLSNAFKYDTMNGVSPYLCNTTNKRTGMLCGQCEDGYSIAINSIYFGCINCQGKIWNGWLFLIFCQFLPQTLLVLFIVLFNIKLAVGIVGGFILYCQILSLQIPGWYYPPYLSLNDGSHVGNDQLTFFITSTYSLFNMRFLSFLSFDWDWNVCLSTNMSALSVISFWYTVAFYPFLLLTIIGVWLVLYDRGIHFVVKATVPLHRRLARFWHYFNIEPSLVQSFVSIYILSLMEIISISTKLLHYSSWQSLSNKDTHGRSFFYDASVLYFGWPHAIFGLFALVILVFVVGLPLFFLLFYQFWWFHDILNYFKIRYRWCMMVGDVFSGPFKDGSKNRVDFSYVAGLYVLFRVVSMCLFYITETEYTLYSEICLAFLLASFIMIFRPFRSTLINFAEFLIFFNLGLMAGLCLAFQGKGRIACIYAIMHIPTLLILVLVSVKLYKNLKKYFDGKKKKSIILNDVEIENEEDSYKEDFRVPDRVLNPDNYNEHHVGFLPSQIDLSRLPSDGNENEGEERGGTPSRTQFVPSLRSSIRNSDSDYGTGRGTSLLIN